MWAGLGLFWSPCVASIAQHWGQPEGGAWNKGMNAQWALPLPGMLTCLSLTHSCTVTHFTSVAGAEARAGLGRAQSTGSLWHGCVAQRLLQKDPFFDIKTS